MKHIHSFQKRIHLSIDVNVMNLEEMTSLCWEKHTEFGRLDGVIVEKDAEINRLRDVIVAVRLAISRLTSSDIDAL